MHTREVVRNQRDKYVTAPRHFRNETPFIRVSASCSLHLRLWVINTIFIAYPFFFYPPFLSTSQLRPPFPFRLPLNLSLRTPHLDVKWLKGDLDWIMVLHTCRHVFLSASTCIFCHLLYLHDEPSLDFLDARHNTDVYIYWALGRVILRSSFWYLHYK